MMNRSRLRLITAMALLAAANAGVVHAVPGRAAEGGSSEMRLTDAPGQLHLLVGHSLLLRTDTRMKRVYVSNPKAVDSVTATPNELLLTAKEPGSSSVVVWDEAGHSTITTVSADVDVDALKGALAQAFPGEPLEVAAQEDHVQLAGVLRSQAEVDAAVRLAGGYAKQVSNSIRLAPPHVKEVQLKVRFIEVDRIKLAQFGVNFFSGGKNTSQISSSLATGLTQTASATGLSSSLNTANPMNLFLYNSQFNVGLALADLEQKQVAQLLAEPTITALSGEEASFISGGEFPFPVVQSQNNSVVVTVEFKPYGVKLNFTPTINPDGTIRLKVAPEVSALDYTNEVTISGYTIPAISVRRAQTEVELKDGQSFAISGLLDRRVTDQLSKTPGIASVPILGELFHSKNKNLSVIELILVVTPVVVDPLTTTPAVTEPKMVTPSLDTTHFDQQFHSKKP